METLEEGKREGKMAANKMVLGSAQVTCVLVLVFVLVPLFVFDFFWCKDECLLYRSSSTSSQDIKDGDGIGGGRGAAQDYSSLLRRLLEGEDQSKLNNSGFACVYKKSSVVCVTTQTVYINSVTDHLQLQFQPLNYTPFETPLQVAPYAWKDGPLKTVTPVKIYPTTTAPPPCKYNLRVPVVIFSSAGLQGNQFHEFDEMIIPLFITSRLFQTRVQFMITDYRPSFVKKYAKILSGLSRYPIISPAQITGAHCFPGAVIGLKFHKILGLNSSDAPLGYSIRDFKEFLRQTYRLKARNIAEISNMGKPVLVLIGREESRKLVNEGEMVKMMEELGFRVIVARAGQLSKLDEFSQILGSTSVLVGVHGAGLTDQVFLPDGALVIQLVPWALDWASKACFGDTSQEMGLRYLEYRIDPEESTLYEKYGPDSPEMKDPQSFSDKGYDIWSKIYIQEQNIKVNITRFKERFVSALQDNIGPSTNNTA